jgi:predicted amidohydrolase YtcJ
MIWAVVNRVTRSWKVLGPDERIDPYAALLTVTRYSAIQAFEEKTKGTLEKYKLADLVILDSNPLKVAPETISSILVLETIK